MKKTMLYTELAYVLGMVGLSLSVALMTRADFGVSMVVAPAYLLYLKLNPVLPFFTFGMAEYTLQAALLLSSGTCWAWGWARSASPVSSRPTSPRRSMSCW